MNVTVQFSMEQEALAIPILFRHSPGVILPHRTYVIDIAAAQLLHNAGIGFRVTKTLREPLSGGDSPTNEGV